MKLPFTIYDLRSAIWKKSGESAVAARRDCAAVNHQSSVANRKSERGIALVITLILLAVTLVMAVAFFAISKRERGSVTTSTDQATARLAADSALANAQAQIIANIFATGNPYNYGLLVSTNYLPPTTGNPLQDLTNLFYSPRPPVFVPSPPGNYLNPTNYDFRFYLDLNRNGQDDPNGYVTNVDGNNNPIFDSSGNPLVYETGDPEWIGVLERPDAAHGPNNKFLSRYIFVAVPADGGLDLNAIHNQTLNQSLGTSDGYFRNQGVGSWEINLAAFLADLNTNQWDPPTVENPVSSPYFYNPPPNIGGNSGAAFDDARALLAFRYADNYNSLATVQNLFGANISAISAFTNNIDLYDDLTPPMTLGSSVNAINQPVSQPWAGADNTNHFFNLTADLFDTTKITPTNFIFRLQQAGAGVSTYDRYTFYRLLNQLGTDSAPESGKMNINYDNLDDYGNVVAGKETNFIAWTPLKFFTNAANRLLRGYTGLWLGGSAQSFSNFTNTYGASITNAFGVANIPVLVNGRFVYTPTINRLLQLAANIYDAAYYTNHPWPLNAPTAYLPSVFQPIFYVTAGGDIYITNFAEVTVTNILANPPLNLNGGSNVIANLQSNPADLVFGVPLIVGAKKGFPNFNAFAMQTEFGLERKLQITRTNTAAKNTTYKVNQMFTISLSNQLAVECWNSYTNYYSRPVNIYANSYITMALTNDEGFTTNYTPFPIISGSTYVNGWPGFNSSQPSFISAQFPVNTNLNILPDEIYRFNSGGTPFLVPDATNAPYESNVVINGSSYPQPNWGLTITNDLQVAMVDANSGRLIDYVQLSGPTTNLNLVTATTGTGYYGMWDTNLNGDLPGVGYQIQVSLDNPGYYHPNGRNPIDNRQFWGSDSTSVENQIDAFLAFYQYATYYKNPSGAQLIAAAKSSLAWQVPYTPSTNFVQYIIWQANDPLVHYLGTDLTDTEPKSGYQYPLIAFPPSDRYQPWNRSVQMASMADMNQNPADLTFKDPLAWSSDYWDFPTNKFPGIGWIGRVHRGTPWQTVFLKATNVLDEVYGLNTWENWTGNLNPYDAADAAPVQDRLLFDFFTTAPNENATRGQLSINQPHIAAWSALLAGMVVPTNLFGAYTILQPAGPAYLNAPGPPFTNMLGYIVQNGLNGINDTRKTFVNADGLTNVFEHVGDILAVHALSDWSPFLAGMDGTYGVSDEMYEWLPQQMMSLLRVSAAPRYVIYSYGQTLKPAPNAIVTGGAFSGMITNYQVVSEVATRAVVQVNTQVTTNSIGVISTNYSTQIEQFNLLPPD